MGTADLSKETRQRLHVTQGELGLLIGAHAKTVNRWECGHDQVNSWRLSMLEALHRHRIAKGKVRAWITSKGPTYALARILAK